MNSNLEIVIAILNFVAALVCFFTEKPHATGGLQNAIGIYFLGRGLQAITRFNTYELVKK